LKEGCTATDLVLTVTQMLRKKGVVGKFVEFYGAGLSALSLPDRATVANMAPEYGATMGFFPVDRETLDFLRFTNRDGALVALVEAYTKEQGLFRSDETPDPVFVDTLEGAGTWPRLPAMVKQNLRDNAYTLIGQVRDNRPPFSKADAESIKMPTLFILGARTKGLLPKVLHALAAHVPYSKTAIIPNATHPMFEQAPQKYSEVVLDFLAG